MTSTIMNLRRHFADDEMAEAIKRGVKQCVVLGATLGALAYQNVHPELRVVQLFNLDNNFETQSLADALKQSSFKPSEATLFSWLGAVRYGTPESAIEALSFIASMPKESGVVLDYSAERFANSADNMGLDAFASRMSHEGGPTQLVLEPQALRIMLKGVGFQTIDDLGPTEINKRYSATAELAHLVTARV